MCSGSCSNRWSSRRRPANGAVVPGATLGRQVVEGVLWILCTGAQWAELPKDKFPPYQTCHRRFQRWVREGTLVQVLRALAEDLLAREQLDLSDAFIGASF